MEVGSFLAPTLFAGEAELHSLDFYSTSELQEQARNLGRDPAQVANVDYVCKSERYDEVIGRTFDLIIANHVAEHVKGFVAWLQMLRRLLNEGGLLFLVLPDKRYSFDRFRPDTPLSHLLYEYLSPESGGEALHSLETAMYYDMGYIGGRNVPRERFDLDVLRGALKGWHPGVHCHVFQCESAVGEVIGPLCAMNLIDFDLVDAVMSYQLGEFAVVLRAGRQATTWDRVSSPYSIARDTAKSGWVRRVRARALRFLSALR